MSRTKHVPRSSRVVGLVPRPAPDPSLKPWPGNVIQIVAATPATISVRGITGRITDCQCADCGTRLCVDSDTIAEAEQMPQRQGRPLKMICIRCCQKYDRGTIDVLIDRRRKSAAVGASED